MLTVSYPDLLADPSGETDRIVDFLGLKVGSGQRQRAMSLVGAPRGSGRAAALAIGSNC